MKRIFQTAIAVAYAVCVPVMFADGAKITLTNGAVGKNLQTYTTVGLSEPLPKDTPLTITSNDPTRLLLSKMPEAAGSASITVTIRAGFRESGEFWLQALSDSGKAKYTVSAEGLETVAGTVTLSHSGIVLIGPHGAGQPEFISTPRGWASKITLRSARLDDALKFVEYQYVRGGYSATADITSSNGSVGSVKPGSVSILPATDTITAEFKPSAAGTTTISVKATDFSAVAGLNSTVANIRLPGMFVANEMTIGQNLQLASALSLGEPAPEGGATVTLTSSEPGKLLLSAGANEPGSASINIKIPANGVSTTYYLQALASSGTVKHTAASAGYVTRTGTISLAPSGVIISPSTHGPPDEAELFRPASAGTQNNVFVSVLSEHKSTPLTLFTAFLHPVTRRTADITVQPLRPGFSVSVELKNENPNAGTIASPVIIQGGSDRATVPFTPVSTGQTLISVTTPAGFATPSNSTGLMAVVR